MKDKTSARRLGARLALVASLLASAEAIRLLLWGSGFEAQVLGVRIRSNDPVHPAVLAVLAFSVFALLRRPLQAHKIDRVAAVARLRAAGPLLLILGGAALVRGWALGFGLPHLGCRPDEEAIASIAGGLYGGNLNPHSFTYPPLFMLAVAGGMRAIEIAQRVLAIVEIHPGLPSSTSVAMYSIARVLSAASGVATAAVLYHTAMRLFGRRVGLVSAALLAFAFLNVRDSHFGVTDVAMTFMLLAAFSWVVRLSASGDTRDLVGAAVLAGLATATKYNAALVALPAVLALLTDPTGRALSQRLWRVVLFGVLMLSTFLIVAPFSVVEYRQLIEELRLVSQHLSGGHGPDLGRGWTYHVTTTLRYGLGLPLLLAGIVGLLLLMRLQPRVGILVALFPVTYYVVAGSGYTVFTRHMQPMVPFLCLTAGYGLTKAAESLAAALRRPAWSAAVVTLGVATVLANSVESVFRFDQLLARPDSRLLARRWIEARFRAGTTIAQPIPGSARVITFSDNEVPYVAAELTPSGPRPDLVVLYSSPLHDNEPIPDDPDWGDDYERQFVMQVAESDPANVYDRQDDFYLPMSGFKRIDRPGPNLQIYVHRRIIEH